jgi:hypothetical protein
MRSPSTMLPVESFRRSPRLDAILLADAARERARAVRDLLIALLAVMGVPLWLMAASPGRWTEGFRLAAASGWALAGAGLIVAILNERRWARVRSNRIRALGPLPALRAERRGDGACAPAAEAED